MNGSRSFLGGGQAYELLAALASVVAIACYDSVGNGDHGWRAATADDFALEHLDSVPLHIAEVRRFALAEPARSSVMALAAWSDGTIWLGGDGKIWEVASAGDRVREVLDAEQGPGGFGRALAMARTPGNGMLLVGSNGVRVFPDQSDGGVFHPMDRFMVRGVAAFANGDYVLSYGQYPDDPDVAHSLHRYGSDGTHNASWHPAFAHDDWRIVMQIGGGPVAVTAAGDLVVLEAAPFKMTRYSGGNPGAGDVVLVDETVVAASELQKALARGEGTYSPRWNQAVFVDELPGGLILSVVKEAVDRSRAWRSLWVVATTDGAVIARTRIDRYYWFMAPLAPGRYVGYSPGDIVEVEARLGTPR